PRPPAVKAAGTDCALGKVADGSSAARCHDVRGAAGNDPGSEPRRTAMGAVEGCLRIRGLKATKPDLGLQKAGEFLLEARHSAAAIEQVLLAAGPCRMRFWVDIEMQRVARLAPGRAGAEFGAVGHDDLHGVIVGM